MDGYVWMGTASRFIADAQEGWPVLAVGGMLTNVDGLRKSLSDYGMNVTLRVAVDLWQIAEKWRTELDDSDEPEALTAQRRLSEEEAKELQRVGRQVRDTMMAEATGLVAFVTRPKRYDTSRLLGDVGGLMAPGTFEAMTDIARYDFNQAGRCLAYELPTAAAFHIMRGTEDVLRQYYRSMVRRDRIKVLTWGGMTDHLDRRRVRPPEVLKRNLDNLRHSFRNPTQHPEKVYDIEEAQDLFGLSVDVVTRMHRHLADLGIALA